jgi:hypothetical protein
MGDSDIVNISNATQHNKITTKRLFGINWLACDQVHALSQCAFDSVSNILNEWINEWMNELNEWMNWMNWMNEWMNQSINQSITREYKSDWFYVINYFYVYCFLFERCTWLGEERQRANRFSTVPLVIFCFLMGLVGVSSISHEDSTFKLSWIWMNQWINESMNEWINESMNEWMSIPQSEKFRFVNKNSIISTNSCR